MANPLEAFCNWFRALSPEIQQDMAFMVAATCPQQMFLDPELNRDANGLLKDFTPAFFLERIAVLGSSGREQAGMALMLGALIDFHFRKRSSAEDWERNQKFMMHVAQDTDTPAQIARHAKAMAEQIPLRAKRWERAFDFWSELRQTDLSVEAIEAFLMEQLRPDTR